MVNNALTSYNSSDPSVLKKNIDETKEYILLAHDVGAQGIRVFGDNVQKPVTLTISRSNKLTTLGRS
jgi:sugar phosphate isomerase/epimerase